MDAIDVQLQSEDPLRALQSLLTLWSRGMRQKSCHTCLLFCSGRSLPPGTQRFICVKGSSFDSPQHVPSAAFALFHPADPHSNHKLANKQTAATCQRRETLQIIRRGRVQLWFLYHYFLKRRVKKLHRGVWGMKVKRGPRCSPVALDLTLSQLCSGPLFAWRFA